MIFLPVSPNETEEPEKRVTLQAKVVLKIKGALCTETHTQLHGKLAHSVCTDSRPKTCELSGRLGSHHHQGAPKSSQNVKT